MSEDLKIRYFSVVAEILCEIDEKKYLGAYYLSACVRCAQIMLSQMEAEAWDIGLLPDIFNNIYHEAQQDAHHICQLIDQAHEEIARLLGMDSVVLYGEDAWFQAQPKKKISQLLS
ncbi:hypothetical protein [Methylophilus luteus]|uniref:Uncharacterized protein n=1 Tax=Methylophilus luteus TaxID=640108 RepID=A0ABW3FBU4_9PROT